MLKFETTVYLIAATNPSSRQCSDRRNTLASKLQDLLESQEDTNLYVKQSLVMELLDLKADEKSILTRAIKATFPESIKKIIMIEHEYMYPLFNK